MHKNVSPLIEVISDIHTLPLKHVISSIATRHRNNDKKKDKEKKNKIESLDAHVWYKWHLIMILFLCAKD